MKLSELDAAFDAAMKDAEDEYEWYRWRRWPYVILSWLTRGLAAVALGFGVLLPLSKSAASLPSFVASTFEGPAQAAVACIAFAGLMVGANEIFMISATWVRYVGAMMKLKTLRKATELDWAAHKASLAEPVSPQDAQKALALFKALVIGSRQVVESETSSWSSELVKAIEQLRALVSEQKTAVDALAKEEQKTREAAQKLAAASTHGTVRVKIEGAAERLAGTIKITAATRSEERSSPVSTVVLTEVVGGIHKVTLAGTDTNGKDLFVENVVQVVPSSVADVSLIVPKG